jgi:hypothetical protein
MRAITTIFSHLSDVQVEMFGNAEMQARANMRINFAKFLMNKYQDTNTRIDPEEEFEEFCKKFPHMVPKELQDKTDNG